MNTSVARLHSRGDMPSPGWEGRRPARVPGRPFARLAALLAGLALTLSVSGAALAGLGGTSDLCVQSPGSCFQISGTVTGPDGTGLANMHTSAEDTSGVWFAGLYNGQPYTDSSGQYYVNVPPGTYTVHSTDDSNTYSDCSFGPQGCPTVTVTNANVGGIDIVMVPFVLTPKPTPAPTVVAATPSPAPTAVAATPTPAPKASSTASENTTSGTNVAVSPTVSGGGATGIALTFTQVSAPGTTSVAVSNAGPPVPGDFVSLASSPTYYDVSTTATHTGSITFCVPYDPIADPDPSLVRLLHWNGTSWDDVTTSADPATATVCGTTTSLSPFGVAKRVSNPAAAPTVITPGPSANSAANSTSSPTSGGLLVGIVIAVVVIAVLLLAAWWLVRRRREAQARL